MKWSLNTYQTAQDWSLKETCEMASKTGYDAVEFLMDFKQPHGFEWNTPRENWKPLKLSVARLGQTISSLTSCQVFHHPTAEERAESVNRVKRVIEMANYMESPNVRVLGDRFNDENRGEVIGWVIDALGLLGVFAEPHGITVSIEMHGSFTDPHASLAVMEGVNLPNVGLIFNGQFVGCDDSIDPIFSLCGKYMTSVHTHAVEQPATLSLYHQMFQWLKARDFGGYISNECAYRGPDPEKVLAMYVALFKTMAA